MHIRLYNKIYLSYVACRQAIRGDSVPAAAKFASSCTKCIITVTIKYVIYANPNPHPKPYLLLNLEKML